MKHFTAAFLTTLAMLPFYVIAEDPLKVISPNGKLRMEFSVRNAGGTEGAPHYRVLRNDVELIGYSRLGIDEVGGASLGNNCEVINSESRDIREDYVQVSGKQRNVAARGSELRVHLRETAAPRREWEIHFRAYDDGAAFRYHFPKQAGWELLEIKQERTEFRFPSQSKAFALPLSGYLTSYENRYETKPLGELSKDWLFALPLLLECPNGNWAAIMEANLDEYAGMYLVHPSDGLLASRLSPLPKEPSVAVRHSLPHASPWRVIMVADHVGRLVESNIVLHLSAPCEIPDTSWIKTGKTTFPWWNGFYEKDVGFKPGLNTATAKYYIDFCAEAGIPYHSLDGVENVAWYGGPIVPYEGAEPTKGVEGLDFQEVLAYARDKGIKIRLWMHWAAAEKHMHKAFPLYREWGIEGVMLDFMDRDDQEMNRFVRKAVKLAADNHLTLTLHGCPKPTGLERTFPNLLTHEGVMNLEYDKWDKVGITSEHELTIPFTRMLAGPLDFHQGSFRTVKPSEFAPRNDAPLVMGTPARTLASYVVFQNHLSMVADYPCAYRGHPGLPILAAIPTTWDNTKVLDAKVGEYIVIARRHGSAWYIGLMTNGTPRTLEVPLGFLSERRYQAEIVSDDEKAKYGLSTKRKEVAPMDTLVVRLSSGGGGFVRIWPE
jgi:alpha-glucosidase